MSLRKAFVEKIAPSVMEAHGEKVHAEHHSKHGDKIKSIVYGGERRKPTTRNA